jgi:glyoxylase-like metal-dependent hydrolase (beta-lactamase superfamily II)
MSHPTILTIDLNFQNKPGTIGAYLIPHSDGGLLVESGPASTIPELVEGLNQYGFSPPDITDVLLTHIHLDHAGAAGWLAQHGARIHVHPNGANHLINPEKLLASAARIYGSQMEPLWGTFFPVPESQINVPDDNSLITIGELTIQALDVPGHANHHLAYLVEGACFTGDIGGIRVHNQKYISLPMPPPDLNLEQWRTSVRRLIDHHPQQLIPTHFGIYPDAEWHLNTILDLLDIVDRWIKTTMSLNPSVEKLRDEFLLFEANNANKAGLQELSIDAQQTANPSIMSADGIYRFWHKFR